MKMNGTGVFQAIVRKEMRENLVWAALGLVLMFVVLIGSLPASDNYDRQSAPDVIRIFNITPFAAVIALMIGRAQIVSENRGDKWGFLVHRPVSRSTLFWGKAIGGMALYLGAAGFPTLCIALWLAMPGHVAAPFDWRMTLPAVADLICGLVFYFAGMLTAMRNARWYASRTLGIGAGIICGMVILTQIHTLSMSLAFCAAGICLTAIAARGTFISGGEYAPQSRISRVAVGVSIASGLAVVGYLATVFVMNYLLERPPGGIVLSGPSVRMRYTVSSDGTIVQTLFDEGGSIQVNDIQGNPIEKYKDAIARKTLESGVIEASASIDPDGRRGLGPPNTDGYRSTFDIYSQLESKYSDVYWYYIQNRELIAGYDSTSKRLVGWLGPDGFSAGNSLPANRFHGVAQSYWHGESLIAFTNAVYRVDVAGRRVAKVFTAPAGESILGAAETSNGGMPVLPETPPGFDVIATTKNVYVQSLDGTPQLAVARDPKAEGYGFVSVYKATKAPGEPMFVLYAPEGGSKLNLFAALAMPVQVSQINRDRTVGMHFTLPRPGYQVRPPEMPLCAMTIPMAWTAVFELVANYQLNSRYSIPEMTATWLWPGLMALAIAAFIFAWGRRYAFAPGRLLLWTALGLGLGPLGLALMFSLIDWPAKEKCSTCGRMRVVTREHCEHCSASFPAPAPDGTEIFEL